MTSALPPNLTFSEFFRSVVGLWVYSLKGICEDKDDNMDKTLLYAVAWFVVLRTSCTLSDLGKTCKERPGPADRTTRHA